MAPPIKYKEEVFRLTRNQELEITKLLFTTMEKNQATRAVDAVTEHELTLTGRAGRIVDVLLSPVDTWSFGGRLFVKSLMSVDGKLACAVLTELKERKVALHSLHWPTFQGLLLGIFEGLFSANDDRVFVEAAASETLAVMLYQLPPEASTKAVHLSELNNKVSGALANILSELANHHESFVFRLRTGLRKHWGENATVADFEALPTITRAIFESLSTKTTNSLTPFDRLRRDLLWTSAQTVSAIIAGKGTDPAAKS